MTKDEIMRALGEALLAAGQQLLASPQIGAPTQEATAEKPPKYLPVTTYAKRVGFSPTTVRGWIKAGLPSIEGPRGNRINVDAADEWIAAGGARGAAIRLAQQDARRVRRAS